MWRLLSVLILVGSSFFVIFSQDLVAASSQGLIKEGVKKNYTIKAGDSLWKVAENFLDDPHRWKELWLANPQIKNPDLLYPGDVVSIVFVEGKPRLTVSSRKTDGKPMSTEPKWKEVGQTIKLSPKIRATPAGKETFTVPLSQVGKFLSKNRIFRSVSEITNAPYVFSIHNNRLAASSGDKVYIRGNILDRPGIYEIIREGGKIIDPITGKVSGVEGIKIADAKLIHLTDGQGVVMVLNARIPVKLKDRFVEKDTFVPESMFFPKTPNTTVVGKVMAIVSGGKKAGKYHSIIISLGTQEGLQPGDMLTAQESTVVDNPITGKKTRLPTKKLGTVMIYRPFERLSYGIIMSSSEDLQVGDDLTNY